MKNPNELTTQELKTLLSLLARTNDTRGFTIGELVIFKKAWQAVESILHYAENDD